jgi:hypothetical protein
VQVIERLVAHQLPQRRGQILCRATLDFAQRQPMRAGEHAPQFGVKKPDRE